jgi:hypothetical protein
VVLPSLLRRPAAPTAACLSLSIPCTSLPGTPSATGGQEADGLVIVLLTAKGGRCRHQLCDVLHCADRAALCCVVLCCAGLRWAVLTMLCCAVLLSRRQEAGCGGWRGGGLSCRAAAQGGRTQPQLGQGVGQGRCVPTSLNLLEGYVSALHLFS